MAKVGGSSRWKRELEKKIRGLVDCEKGGVGVGVGGAGPALLCLFSGTRSGD